MRTPRERLKAALVALDELDAANGPKPTKLKGVLEALHRASQDMDDEGWREPGQPPRIRREALQDAERQALAHRSLAIRMGGLVREIAASGSLPEALKDKANELLRRVEALEA